jgi:hypothetical protein
MRALRRQVADVWQATMETDTRLVPGYSLETEAETVAISVAFASISARVLDRHVFGDEYARSGKTFRSSKYERFRNVDAQGRVLSGLALIRNSEIHLPVLIDPDVDRVLGIPGTTPTRFRVFPRWRPYRALPAEMKQNRNRGERRQQALAYRSHLAGRLVTETMLDALAFFLRCDPSLARRTSDGELEHFPLPELIRHDPYERRHPEWPSVESVADEARAKAAANPPGGLEREILHRFIDKDGNVEAYVGHTKISATYREAFTERPEQIAADVSDGFRYHVAEADVRVDADGRLMLGRDPLDDVALPAFPVPGNNGRSEEIWRGIFELTQEDGFYYAQQRSTS